MIAIQLVELPHLHRRSTPKGRGFPFETTNTPQNFTYQPPFRATHRRSTPDTIPHPNEYIIAKYFLNNFINAIFAAG